MVRCAILINIVSTITTYHVINDHHFVQGKENEIFTRIKRKKDSKASTLILRNDWSKFLTLIQRLSYFHYPNVLQKLKHNFNNVVRHVYLIDSFKTTKSGDEFYEKSSFRQNNSDSFRIIVSFRELEWKVLIFLVDSKWNHRFFAC